MNAGGAPPGSERLILPNAAPGRLGDGRRDSDKSRPIASRRSARWDSMSLMLKQPEWSGTRTGGAPGGVRQDMVGSQPMVSTTRIGAPARTCPTRCCGAGGEYVACVGSPLGERVARGERQWIKYV